MLRNLIQEAIRRQRRGLSCGLCLQHDNARPHTTPHTVKQIQDLKQEVLPHLPYSLDFEPNDFHLLRPLKTIYVEVTLDQIRR
jgi:hypothetical protein